jgi:predicted ATP-dependent serine protease
VTFESAARSHSCTVAELELALAADEARLIEPIGEWDAVDLLAAEFRETPDILDGVVPVGVTLISAAPKVGKTRLLNDVPRHLLTVSRDITIASAGESKP